MEFEKYTACFEDLDHTPTKLSVMRYTIDKALEQNDWNNALKLYYKFVEEDSLYQDCYQAILLFPEYIAFFEKHSELWNRHQYDMYWAYKGIVHHITAFYQVSLQQIVDIYQSYKEFCIHFNYSLLGYYKELFSFFQDFGFVPQFGVSSIEQCYRIIKKYMDKNRIDKDRTADLEFEVEYLLNVNGDIEAALKKAEPIFSGKYYSRT